MVGCGNWDSNTWFPDRIKGENPRRCGGERQEGGNPKKGARVKGKRKTNPSVKTKYNIHTKLKIQKLDETNWTITKENQNQRRKGVINK